MRCECAHFRACDANARISAHFRACDANAMRMRAYACISRMRCECARISPHAMRCDVMRMRACDAMRMRASRGNLCVSGTVPRFSAKPQHLLVSQDVVTDLFHMSFCEGHLAAKECQLWAGSQAQMDG